MGSVSQRTKTTLQETVDYYRRLRSGGPLSNHRFTPSNTYIRLTGAGSEDYLYAFEYVMLDLEQPTSSLAWGTYDQTVTGSYAMEVNLSTGLPTDDDKIYPVTAILPYMDSGSPVGLTLFFLASSVPPGSGQYKVLQLDANDSPFWDYPRAY